MRISNIIASYNRKENLLGHLKYIKNQSFKDFEVIVCDDGSTDGTLRMLLDFKEFPLKIFETRSYNICWKSKALNMGIQDAQGDILVFHDDDSWAHKDCFKEYNNSVKEGVVVLGQQPLTRDALDVKLPTAPLYEKAFTRQRLYKQGRLSGKWLIGNNFACWREDAIKAGMFNEEFKGYGHEDTEFGYRLGKIGCKFVFNPNAITWHNNVDSTYTKEDRIRSIKRSKKLYNKIINN